MDHNIRYNCIVLFDHSERAAMPHHQSYTLTPIGVDTKDLKVQDVSISKEELCSKDLDPKGLRQYQHLVTVMLFLTWVLLVRKY